MRIRDRSSYVCASDLPGDVNFKAAESTRSSHAYGAELKVSAEAERKGKKDSDAGGSDGAADKPSWKSATPTKKDGGKNGRDSGSWHSASPSTGGDKSSSSGNDSTSTPRGSKDGPTSEPRAAQQQKMTRK